MNRKSIKKKLLACVCLVAVLLAGCGGKSGSIGSLKDIGKYEIFVMENGNAKYFIAGNSILQVYYNEDKTVESTIKTTYDERGNLLQRELYGCDPETTYNSSSRFMQQYTYDDKDHLIEKKTVSGTYIQSLKHKYENDQISEWTEYSGYSFDGESVDEDSIASTEYKLSYNEKGQLESAETSLTKNKYIYNEEGFLEKLEYYNIDNGIETLSIAQLYDGNGKYWYDSTVLSNVYYDEEGNEKEIQEYKYKSFYMKKGTITPKEEGSATAIASASTSYRMYKEEPVAYQFQWYLADGQEALDIEYGFNGESNGQPDFMVNNASYAICDENGKAAEQGKRVKYGDFVYDDKGNLTSQTLYRNKDGKAIWYYTYEYDKNNNLIIEKELPVAKIFSGTVGVYEYDKNNQPISYKAYSVKNWKDSDFKSDLASSTIDVSKLALVNHEEYINEYDSDKNLISSTTKYILRAGEQSDKEDSVYVYSYDEDGRVIQKKIFYDGSEEVDTVIEWKYFN